ncbi:hypothetical protein CWM52_08160 [Raoultella sp. T31]|nr:hypothetical protein CWM52_08160 [Raoultella sp. T31]
MHDFLSSGDRPLRQRNLDGKRSQPARRALESPGTPGRRHPSAGLAAFPALAREFAQSADR